VYLPQKIDRPPKKPREENKSANRNVGLLPLAGLLGNALAGVELARETLAGALAQSLLDELAGRLARRTSEASGGDGGFALGARR